MLVNLKKENDGFLDETGCFWVTRKDYILMELLGFCGCGNPEEVAKYVIKFLRILDRKNWRDYDDLDYMFFVYWANNKGFAEHGSTARCSWLTDKGKELLAELKKLDLDN